MSESQLAVISSESHSLSDEASNLVYRIPQLLRCLRDLEDEEARLNAQARQLLEPQLSPTKGRLPTSILSTPVSKPHPERVVDSGATPPGIFRTPVKALLMQSLGITMSVKSKRKGRIFMGGDVMEFGDRK